MAECAGRRGGERGSSLLLFPAGLLIVLVLAAIAVDTSIAFMAQRELANAAEAAANDAASQGIDNDVYYQQARVELDAAAVESLAVAKVRAAIDESRHAGLSVQAIASPPAGAGCPWTVRVTASSRVSFLFAQAIPGGPHQADVHASAVAGPAQADATGDCGG